MRHKTPHRLPEVAEATKKSGESERKREGERETNEHGTKFLILQNCLNMSSQSLTNE